MTAEDAFPKDGVEIRADRFAFITRCDRDGTPVIGLLAWDPAYKPICVTLTLTAASQLAHTLLALADGPEDT